MRKRPDAGRHKVRGVQTPEDRRVAHPQVVPTPTETEPFELVVLELCESAEHGAEERVAPGRLSERTWARKQPRHPRLAAGRVEPIDEICERKQSDVLRQCHAERESAGVDGDPPSRLVED